MTKFDEYLKVVEKRLNRATPGRWWTGHISEIEKDFADIDSENGPIAEDVRWNNLDLLINAPTDIAKLLEIIKELREENMQLSIKLSREVAEHKKK